MAKRVAQIVDGIVRNVTMMPDDFQSAPPFYVETDEGGIDDIYDAETGQFIKPVVEEAITVPETISDRQFFQQLTISGIISEEEAIAAVATGSIPQAFDELINQLPESEKFNAKILLSGAVDFNRNHPLTEQFRISKGYSVEQLDQIWIAASLL